MRERVKTQKRTDDSPVSYCKRVGTNSEPHASASGFRHFASFPAGAAKTPWKIPELDKTPTYPPGLFFRRYSVLYPQSMDWFENDDFWRDLYPYMFAADRFSASQEQVEQIIKLTGFTGRTVLDLCCGPGRHAIAFAQRGIEVTAVDRSPFLLDRARERASEAAVSVEWILEDMRRFIRRAMFDLSCSLF